MKKNRRQNTHLNDIKEGAQGIPEIDGVEKLDTVIPVKMQQSLADAIPAPKSTWIRNLILRELSKQPAESW